MLESFVADVVSRKLGRFCKRIRADDLKVALMRQDVRLANLELDRSLCAPTTERRTALTRRRWRAVPCARPPSPGV